MQENKKYLHRLKEYPSLLVSGVAQGAYKYIETLEQENELLKKQIEELKQDKA